MNRNTECEPDPTSVANFSNALMAEWEQIPAARFQNLVEKLPGSVEAVVEMIFPMTHSTITFMCDVQVLLLCLGVLQNLQH